MGDATARTLRILTDAQLDALAAAELAVLAARRAVTATGERRAEVYTTHAEARRVLDAAVDHLDELRLFPDGAPLKVGDSVASGTCAGYGAGMVVDILFTRGRRVLCRADWRAIVEEYGRGLQYMVGTRALGFDDEAQS